MGRGLPGAARRSVPPHREQGAAGRSAACAAQARAKAARRSGKPHAWTAASSAGNSSARSDTTNGHAIITSPGSPPGCGWLAITSEHSPRLLPLARYRLLVAAAVTR
jgi:hypothetical protein